MGNLNCVNVTVQFGDFTAVSGVTAQISSGVITSVIGPNGAGKTTLFNAITGVTELSSGQVLLNGCPVERKFSGRVIALFALTGVLLGIGFGTFLNIQSLWQVAVIDNYVFRGDFPWKNALQLLILEIGELTFLEFWLPSLLAMTVTFVGGILQWSRNRRSPAAVCEAGIARTFQNIRLFRELTVLENMLVPIEAKHRSSIFECALRMPRYYSDRRTAINKSRELLHFVGLLEKSDTRAAALSYGEQRRLEVARALATDPKLIFLDEPAAGTNPTEAKALMDLISAIRDRGITVVLIEHHMKVVMGISEHILVLNYGIKIADGSPQEISTDAKVIEAYLGRQHAHD